VILHILKFISIHVQISKTGVTPAMEDIVKKKKTSKKSVQYVLVNFEMFIARKDMNCQRQIAKSTNVLTAMLFCSEKRMIQFPLSGKRILISCNVMENVRLNVAFVKSLWSQDTYAL
jgi:hypothetical protein